MNNSPPDRLKTLIPLKNQNDTKNLNYIASLLILGKKKQHATNEPKGWMSFEMNACRRRRTRKTKKIMPYQ